MRLRNISQNVFAVAVFLLLGGIAPTADAAEIKIGVLGSFSGPYADWGRQFQRSVDLFLEQNGGKVGDNTLSVVYRDVGGNNPQRARQLAEELVVRDQVQYLAGLDFTPTVIAVADVINAAKIPFVIFNSAMTDVPQKSPYFVRTGFTLWAVTIPAAEYAITQHKRRAVILIADYAPGYDAIAGFTKGFTDGGGTIADVIKVPLGTVDFSSYLQRVRDSKPDVIWAFIPHGPMTINLIGGYVQGGFHAAGIDLYGTTETEESSLPALGDGALGVITALHYAPYLDNPTNRKFLADYQAKYGKDELPDVASVAAWDGMRLLAHMIEATGGKKDGEKAIASVKGLAWDSPRGPVWIDPDTRDIVQNVYIRRVEKVDGTLLNKVIFTYPNMTAAGTVKSPPH